MMAEHQQMLKDIEAVKLNLEKLTNAVEKLATKKPATKRAAKKSTVKNGK